MNHAFLILSSYGIDYLKNVLNQFQQQDNIFFYIHLNGQSLIDFNDNNQCLNKYKNIRYCNHYNDSKRFSFDVCFTIHFLFNTAFNDDINIDYYHLMSESCYLTVTFDKFDQFFNNANNKSFIYCYRQDDIDKYYIKLNDIKHYIYYGYDWFSIHNNLLKIIFTQYQNQINIYHEAYLNNNFKFSGSLPENVFATIICHDIFKDNKDEMNKYIEFISLRYQNYYDYGNLGCHARTLTLSEFMDENNKYQYDKDMILNKTLILRKIDYKNNDSIALIEYLKTQPFNL